MRLSLRPRPADHIPVDEPVYLSEEDFWEQREPAPIATAESTVGSRLATAASTVVLYGCLLLAPVGAVTGLMALAGGGEAEVVPAAAAERGAGDGLATDQFATQVVLTWLAASRDHDQELTSLVPSAAGAVLPETPLQASAPMVAEVTTSGPVSSVTVAATVSDAAGHSARRFFRVPVSTGPAGQMAALTLPAEVAAPQLGATEDLDYDSQLSTSSPAGVAVTQFLQGYLAGSGDVSRYLAPGTAITAVTPPPFVEVTVSELASTTDVDVAVAPADGQQLRVLATAVAVVTDEQQVAMVYALTLTARAGRWEIAAIDPVPAHQTQSSTPQPTPSGVTE